MQSKSIRRVSSVLFCALMVFLLSVISTSLAQDAGEQGKEIVAKVGDQVITISEFMTAVSSFELNFQEQLAQMDEASRQVVLSNLRQQILNNMINQILILNDAKRLKIIVSKEELENQIDLAIRETKSRFPNEDAFKGALEQQGLTEDGLRNLLGQQLEGRLLSKKWFDQEIENKINVSDDEISGYYKDNKTEFEIPEQVRARHILILVPSEDIKEEKKKEIEAILVKAKEGEDFAALAQRYSEGPSAARGGDLGFFGEGAMVPEFEKTAFALKEGEIGEIVLTQFGYHIIKVEDRKEKQTKELEKVSDNIREKLTQQKRENILTSRIEKMKSRDKVEILFETGETSE